MSIEEFFVSLVTLYEITTGEEQSDVDETGPECGDCFMLIDECCCE